MQHVKVLHVVGRKNAGKTTLVAALVRELTGRGIRVGTIKHTSHDYELDVPRKDSHVHRQAGAVTAAVMTPGQQAVYIPRVPAADTYAALRPIYQSCDIVLIEGDINGPGPKLEVWREKVGAVPYALERDDIAAIATDDGVNTVKIPGTDPAFRNASLASGQRHRGPGRSVPAFSVLARGDVSLLADWVLKLAAEI